MNLAIQNRAVESAQVKLVKVGASRRRSSIYELAVTDCVTSAAVEILAKSLNRYLYCLMPDNASTQSKKLNEREVGSPNPYAVINASIDDGIIRHGLMIY